jgi:hypothetical protein
MPAHQEEPAGSRGAGLLAAASIGVGKEVCDTLLVGLLLGRACCSGRPVATAPALRLLSAALLHLHGRTTDRPTDRPKEKQHVGSMPPKAGFFNSLYNHQRF